MLQRRAKKRNENKSALRHAPQRFLSRERHYVTLHPESWTSRSHFTPRNKLQSQRLTTKL